MRLIESMWYRGQSMNFRVRDMDLNASSAYQLDELRQIINLSEHDFCHKKMGISLPTLRK